MTFSDYSAEESAGSEVRLAQGGDYCRERVCTGYECSLDQFYVKEPTESCPWCGSKAI